MGEMPVSRREIGNGSRLERISEIRLYWEIRVDSLLKLDRAAKLESIDDSHEEVPR